MTSVFINGFGRIGRTVLRAWALNLRAQDVKAQGIGSQGVGAQGVGDTGRPAADTAPQTNGPAIDLVDHPVIDIADWSTINIAGINDIAASDLCAHLFAYDSVFGPYPGTVRLEDDVLVIDSHRIPMSRSNDISQLDLGAVDIVMECTGKADGRDFATRGLRAGAGRILISGPAASADLTVVLGANDGLLADQPIVSNASCTTNALAPLVRLLDDTWGLATGWMTTIHCYTGSQPTIDAPRDDFLRSRAAGLSMVPTTTSAQPLLNKVLPDIAGRIEAAAVRVPAASVSAIDLTVTLDRPVTVDAVHALLRSQSGIIGWTDKPLVSSDLRARSESLIVSLPETRVTAGGLLRVFGWYDNEWGFSSRMLDMACRMTR